MVHSTVSPLGSDDLSPASLAALPFVRQLAPDTPPCMWSVPGIGDYHQGVELGLDFAHRFGRFLVEHPEYAGSGVLGAIVRDMNHHDASAARGCTIGFFSGLEQLLYETPTCRR
ncbi:MAG: hypothetical protein ACRYG5_19225 [Janthinobacterium lividum]